MTTPPGPFERFLAAGQLAVGVLLFTLCGGCTLFVTVSTVVAMLNSPDIGLAMAPMLPVAAIVGGLPALGGFLAMRSGYRWYRANRPKPPPSAPPPG